MQTLEVTFEGKKFTYYTDEKGTYRLFRSPDGCLCVYWQNEYGAWLETGALGHGVSPSLVASWWPELAAGLKA
jgi:hypothetical protein